MEQDCVTVPGVAVVTVAPDTANFEEHTMLGTEDRTVAGKRAAGIRLQPDTPDF